MGKENRPKTDNLAWIKALLFPKKSKPIATVQPAKFETPPTGQTPTGQVSTGQVSTGQAPTGPAPARETPPPVQRPPVQSAPQPSRVTLSQPATSANTAMPNPAPVTVTPASPAASHSAQAVTESTAAQPAGQTAKRPFLPTFWTVASVLSMVVNLILVIVLLVLVRELFTLKALVGDDLLGGLYNNFVLMDEAHIRTTIQVQADVPVQFTLPVQTNTIVQLTEDTRIDGARVTLNTGGLNILSAPTNIILPAGTNLPIALDITVPVNTTIPIVLQVPVDIPMTETELHEPFLGFQGFVGPYYKMLDDLPDSQQIGFCKSAPSFCKIFFHIE